ncbi:energy transducer TonB [Leptothrix discophora]|uniref:TonB family protein n=1 Tax=Leptothrix discophora TaxID=89 RepID=A0ABT9G5D1_LEPDI|nr:TonB family protein [Leptothrix discophora]MDP4301700.1 TonB family protein [Leptothrix discophora]
MRLALHKPDLRRLFSRQTWRSLSTLQRALVVSVLVHAALLTVRFVDPESLRRVLDDTPLEVVLINASSATAPPNAQVIAQRNLTGGGDAERGRSTSPLPPMVANQTGDALEETRRQLEQMQNQQMQLLAQVKRELASLPSPEQRQAGAPRLRPADEDRRRQLLNLLAEIEKRIQVENTRPRRRYVGPAAREGVHALYYDQLRHRIEDVGTRNFPTANGRKLYGELTVLVAVDTYGRVVEAEVVQGSGNAGLDKRALVIVRGAGPYGEFSAAMRSQFDQLVFVSRFRFTRDEGLKANVEDASVQRAADPAAR